ncbi:transposase [Photobacterium gaetbulicola]|uniref:Transposase n=1 Tax=Photobacterium gaetbulicola TaxID=1295392 RepID=A0A0B9H0D5_9GAMM|nr:IS630 family transposase [Photobacterium gaetbulicola]KHT64431.1 transposase [Photobacterium gaetbulicola]
MNIKHLVELTSSEIEQLQSICRKGKHNVRKLKRAKLLLLADKQQHTTDEIVKLADVSSSTIFRTKRRYVEDGLEAALNEGARTGALRKTSAHDDAMLVAIACSEPPSGVSQWSLSLLGDRLISLTDLESISYETIRRRLKENKLKPWQKKMWCIASIDAEYIARMEDVLELYAEPEDSQYPVVNFDEALKNLVADTRQPKLPKPGRSAQIDYEYKRIDTANLFVFFDRHRGWRHVKATKRKTKKDFAYCMKDLVDDMYPHAKKIRLVLDNLATHTAGALYEAFSAPEARRILRKLEFHYTPKHASWLNMVEIEIGTMNKQCLNRRIDSFELLESELKEWEHSRNQSKSSINWLFNVDVARQKLERAYDALN